MYIPKEWKVANSDSPETGLSGMWGPLSEIPTFHELAVISQACTIGFHPEF